MWDTIDILEGSEKNSLCWLQYQIHSIEYNNIIYKTLVTLVYLNNLAAKVLALFCKMLDPFAILGIGLSISFVMIVIVSYLCKRYECANEPELLEHVRKNKEKMEAEQREIAERKKNLPQVPSPKLGDDFIGS